MTRRDSKCRLGIGLPEASVRAIGSLTLGTTTTSASEPKADLAVTGPMSMFGNHPLVHPSFSVRPCRLTLPAIVEADIVYVVTLELLILTINAVSHPNLPIFEVQGLVVVNLKLLAKENFSSGLKMPKGEFRRACLNSVGHDGGMCCQG